MKKSTVAMLMARTSVDCGSRVVVGCVAAEIKEDTFVGEYAGWKILQGNATGVRGFLMGGVDARLRFDGAGIGLGSTRIRLQPHKRQDHLMRLPSL
jgi:hypothetical protein